MACLIGRDFDTDIEWAAQIIGAEDVDAAVRIELLLSEAGTRLRASEGES